MRRESACTRWLLVGQRILRYAGPRVPPTMMTPSSEEGRWLLRCACVHGLNMTSPRARASARTLQASLTGRACRQSRAAVRLSSEQGRAVVRVDVPLTARPLASSDALRGKQRGGYEPGAAEHGPVARSVGEWKFYTANRACNSTGYECHFLPLLQRRRGDASADACDEAFDPGAALRGPTFNSYWWWGVAQSYMLRPSFAEAAMRPLTARAGLARDPDIALHMRFGDKQHDPDSHQPHAADARDGGAVLGTRARICDRAPRRVRRAAASADGGGACGARRSGSRRTAASAAALRARGGAGARRSGCNGADAVRGHEQPQHPHAHATGAQGGDRTRRLAKRLCAEQAASRPRCSSTDVASVARPRSRAVHEPGSRSPPRPYARALRGDRRRSLGTWCSIGELRARPATRQQAGCAGGRRREPGEGARGLNCGG